MSFSTYLVYLGLMFFVMLIAHLNAKGFKTSSGLTIASNPASSPVLLLAAISLALVTGIRYEVGVDWRGYMESYETLRQTGYDRALVDGWEYGYSFINRIFAALNAGYQWMFFTVALIGWAIYLRAIPPVLVSLTIFFVFTGEFYFWSNNAVRQFVAASCFLFALQFAHGRELVKYTAVLLLGALFHVSVLLLWPLYFIVGRIPVNQLVMPGLVVLSFLLGQLDIFRVILQWVEINLAIVASAFGYSSYLPRLTNVDRVEVGLGFYWIVLTNFAVAAVFPAFRRSNAHIKFAFVTFVIGAVLFNMLYHSQLLGRVVTYFLFVKPLLLAYIIHFLPNNLLAVSLKSGIVFGYLLIFIVAIERSSHLCCPYQWQF